MKVSQLYTDSDTIALAVAMPTRMLMKVSQVPLRLFADVELQTLGKSQ